LFFPVFLKSSKALFASQQALHQSFFLLLTVGE
jgi:hypothetical protein